MNYDQLYEDLHTSFQSVLAESLDPTQMSMVHEAVQCFRPYDPQTGSARSQVRRCTQMYKAPKHPLLEILEEVYTNLRLKTCTQRSGYERKRRPDTFITNVTDEVFNVRSGQTVECFEA